MKIAYIAQIGLNKNNGVLNKIKNQVDAWLAMGHEVQLFVITADKNISIDDTIFKQLKRQGVLKLFKTNAIGPLPIDVIKDWFRLGGTFKLARTFLDEFNPDVVYARYGFYQPFYNKVGQKFKLIVEVNTDFDSEYFLLRAESFKRYLRYCYYKLTNSFFLNSISGIAAVTNEIALKYDTIPLGVFPNSLKVSNYDAKKDKHYSENLSVVFLGTPGMAWHGIDILLKLAKHLPSVRFDLIGYNSTDIEKAPKNVILHGFLKKEAYTSILLNSSAAIGSLALYRNKMKEACPLKVREYIACCIPVIVPYNDTAFEINGYPDWALKVDFENENMEENSKKIKSFLTACQKHNIKQNEVLKYVDVSIIEKERLVFFKKIHQE